MNSFTDNTLADCADRASLSLKENYNSWFHFTDEYGYP